jgi:uncharacterized protein (DUF305 family)
MAATTEAGIEPPDTGLPAHPEPEPDPEPEGPLTRIFGPMTVLRVVVLIVAFAFLAGAVGYLVGDRHGSADPLSATDVGFMQDMGYHHDQAVQMSQILLGKDGIDPNLAAYAMEIVIGQRTEMGVFTATLDRFGHSSSPGRTAMGWMGGPGVPLNSMDGLATKAQMAALTKAKGKEAVALWIALMTEHHLGGIHMADYEARHGHDNTTRNLAKAMVDTQHGEVIDIQDYRTRVKLPIPGGFEAEPLKDQRLYPLSFTGH